MSGIISALYTDPEFAVIPAPGFTVVAEAEFTPGPLGRAFARRVAGILSAWRVLAAEAEMAEVTSRVRREIEFGEFDEPEPKRVVWLTDEHGAPYWVDLTPA